MVYGCEILYQFKLLKINRAANIEVVHWSLWLIGPTLPLRRFVRYVERASSGKNNTQCTKYLKAENKTNIPNDQRQRTQQQVNNFVQRNTKLTG